MECGRKNNSRFLYAFRAYGHRHTSELQYPDSPQKQNRRRKKSNSKKKYSENNTANAHTLDISPQSYERRVIF